MSNPYSQPTLSGYNSSPPADDGSEVSANEVTWSKHKDKLGDPLKNFAQAIDSAVLAAFGKMMFNSVAAHSTNYTVQTSDQGKLLDCSNTITITLLSATSAGEYFAITVRNASTGVITVDGNASELINGATTLTLNEDEWAILVSDGSAWTALKHYREVKTVILDTPEQITLSPTLGAWTTVNNTTLNNAKAITAILKASALSEESSTAAASVIWYFRKTGSGDAKSVINRYVIATARGDGSNLGTSRDNNIAYVNLDSNYDFDYYAEQSGTPNNAYQDLFLVGYITYG